MNRVVISLVFACAPAALAAEPPKPPACVSSPSAEYVPGVDAYGRAVAPADLAGQTPPDLGTITVVPRVAVPNNSVVKDAQVVIDLKKQNPAPQNCPPVPVPRLNP
jgi:hypothetical protein